MSLSKVLIVVFLMFTGFGLNGCAAAWVGSKVVGTAVDVSTTAVSLTARGAGAAVGLVTGDDCEAEEDGEDNQNDDASEQDDEDC